MQVIEFLQYFALFLQVATFGTSILTRDATNTVVRHCGRTVAELWFDADEPGTNRTRRILKCKLQIA